MSTLDYRGMFEQIMNLSSLLSFTRDRFGCGKEHLTTRVFRFIAVSSAMFVFYRNDYGMAMK